MHTPHRFFSVSLSSFFVHLIFLLYPPFISALVLPLSICLSLSLFPPSIFSSFFGLVHVPHRPFPHCHVFPTNACTPAPLFLFAPLFSIGDARIFVSSVPLSRHNLRVHRLFVPASSNPIPQPHLFSTELHTCTVFSIMADITLFEFSFLYFYFRLYFIFPCFPRAASLAVAGRQSICETREFYLRIVTQIRCSFSWRSFLSATKYHRAISSLYRYL